MPAQDDAKLIQGRWRLIDMGGDDDKGKRLVLAQRAIWFQITSDSITSLTADERVTTRFSYKLYPDTDPKGIGLTRNKTTVTSIHEAMATLQGIYALEGDQLKLCISEGPRPTRFGHQPLVKQECYVLKRETVPGNERGQSPAAVGKKLWVAANVNRSVFHLDNAEILQALGG